MVKEEISWDEIGHRVATARGIRDMRQSDLADHLGLDRTAIAKIENGTRGLSAVELARIADALRMPVSWFVTESPPAIVSHREEGLLPGTEGPIQLELETLAINVEQLIEWGLLSPPSFESIGINPPSDHEEAEQAARDVRDFVGAADEPLNDVSRVAQQLGLYAFVFETKNRDFDGAYLALEAGGVAYINGSHDSGRRRFSLAHELGHHVFQDAYSTDLNIDGSKEKTEKLINAFSVHLLLPREGAVRFWQNRPEGESVRLRAIHLATRYQLSWTALCTHLKSLELIDSDTWKHLARRVPAKGEILEAKLMILGDLRPSSIPSQYASGVMKAYRNNQITADRAIEMMYETLTVGDLPVPEEVAADAMIGDID